MLFTPVDCIEHVAQKTKRQQRRPDSITHRQGGGTR